MAKRTGPPAGIPPRALPLNRDRVLAAAVEIADERGVGAVTMREVASRLGVEAMSLYNHVANKDDILDGMVDLVVEQFDLPDDVDDWREAMRRRAVSAHEVFGRHPWAPALFDSRESSGPARLRYFDWVLGDADDGRLLAGRRGARVLAARQLRLRLRHPAVQHLGRAAMSHRRRWPRPSWRPYPPRSTPTCIGWRRTRCRPATTPRPTSTSGSRSSSTASKGRSHGSEPPPQQSLVTAEHPDREHKGLMSPWCYT